MMTFMEEQKPTFSPVTRALANVFSYVLHPLFIPLLVTFLSVTALPEFFTSFRSNSFRWDYDVLFIRVAVASVLFPMLVVSLSKALGFVGSITMKDQKDRIIPYVASIIFYFWAFYTFKREGAAPAFYNAFWLGVFIAVVISFVANSFVKISMHTVGWGGVVGYLACLMAGMGMNVAVPLAIAVVLAGVAGTARLVLDAHTPAEVWTGFFVGLVAQVGAYLILG
ncbi:hypothetical protein [Chitinophaga rhizosphaerae]|uniref:hypothetical protein n=1 Tax=Chitinophaga rhizosphaerae TaxID=1864947 RepID=UPI000F80C0F0|nr:hypothetical protein [Chitinophaga rhizosphaerae]